MPEATMNKDYGVISTQYDIRPTGQVMSMESKPITQSMQNTPHDPFRMGVFMANTAHKPRSFCNGKKIHLTFLRATSV